MADPHPVAASSSAAGRGGDPSGDGDLPDVTDLRLSEQDRRALVAWTIACAERLLPVFQAERPDDDRPREALAAAEAFLRGELDIDAVREKAFACHEAAREAEDPSAVAAARVCGQAVAVAHLAGHSRQVPRHTAHAFPGDRSRRDAELAWQRMSIPPRFDAYVYEGD
ncbi:putative immunity protein [uncultured Microbacterium sp.]|uniref:putative immunity protein n=1 Tax=uncultured Microbacterium sp. TaxID=191216 RepID=UPI0025F01712|nr:hypothetical protein [uncultured Microbacterium sp.]